MSSPWHFIDNGENAGVFNMEFDEALARALVGGQGAPTVRLYRWKPWAISLGFNQDETTIDVGRCAADGIDVVRRPTGGRAVFHAQELTYSVVMKSGGRTVLDMHNHISTALVKGLQLFGVNATLTKSQSEFREHYKTPSSIPCFTASARYEIEYAGKKLVGSAQRRFRNHMSGEEVVLQHGSLLTGPAHQDLVNYLILEDMRTRDELARELREKTIDITEIKQEDVDVGLLATCIRRGFEEEWDVDFFEKR